MKLGRYSGSFYIAAGLGCASVSGGCSGRGQASTGAAVGTASPGGTAITQTLTVTGSLTVSITNPKLDTSVVQIEYKIIDSVGLIIDQSYPYQGGAPGPETFTGLAPGNATLIVKAENAANNVVAQTTSPVTVSINGDGSLIVQDVTLTEVPVVANLSFDEGLCNVVVGSPEPDIHVRLLDANGNTVPVSDAVTLALTNPGPDGATLGGFSTVGAVNGVATFSGITFSAVGTGFVLQATNGEALTLTSGAPLTLPNGNTVNPANPVNVVSQSALGAPSSFSARGLGPTIPITDANLAYPQTQTAGEVLSPGPLQFVIMDSNGVVANTASGTVTVALEGGTPGATLGGSTTESFNLGIATFPNLSVSTAGQGYFLSLAATQPTANTVVQLNPFNVTAPP